ncbi:2,4-dichlorophenol 6-monooxygenase [Hibiscus syriacus]|uniref:2,4-dichlorophenol 6-monooxygenase n=1 Tax=Hibiscus syriacus TaxID=106335 RepID=A0A6A2X5Y2_HIBSY|nr:2,4-dichlorophenol 6-monooxygenase [Hibiscus syriacus]
MRSIEDKGYYEISSSNGFEFHRGNGANRGRNKSQPETTPRNSKADDRRLIAPVPQKEQDCSNSEGDGSAAQETHGLPMAAIFVRDMGTEMTPVVSQEPSRTAMSPSARSPIASGSSTSVNYHHGQPCVESHQASATKSIEAKGEHETDGAARGNGLNGLHKQESRMENNNSDQASKQNTLESQAAAWDEAERTKYMARYKREEMKIEAWENHEKRKAEMEMKKMEVKVERLKARAKERCANKLAATRRIAEQKRANAESKLNEKAMKTSERADYIKRTGHLPSSFYFKLLSLCWTEDDGLSKQESNQRRFNEKDCVDESPINCPSKYSNAPWVGLQCSLLNNLVVVQVLRSTALTQSHFGTLLLLKMMLQGLWNVRVQHTYQEGNMVADQMASFTASCFVECSDYYDPPSTILKLIDNLRMI